MSLTIIRTALLLTFCLRASFVLACHHMVPELRSHTSETATISIPGYTQDAPEPNLISSDNPVFYINPPKRHAEGDLSEGIDSDVASTRSTHYEADPSGTTHSEVHLSDTVTLDQAVPSRQSGTSVPVQAPVRPSAHIIGSHARQPDTYPELTNHDPHTPIQSGLPILDAFTVQNWNMEKGLPQSSVNDLLQSQDGYIWVATFGGLVRFDGVSFTTFDRSNTPGLASDRILRINEDEIGNLWLNTEAGLIRFHNGQAERLLLQDHTFNFSPRHIAIDDAGRMWMNIESQLYKLDGNEFLPVEPIRDQSRLEVAIQNPQNRWIFRMNRLYRTDGDAIVYYTTIETDTESPNNVLIQDIKALSEGEDLKLLISTAEHGAFLYHNGKQTHFTEADGLPSRYTFRFSTDHHGNIWIVGYNGVSLWNGTSFSPLQFTKISLIQVTRLLHDTEGNYWIGTQGDGLFRLKPAKVQTIGNTEGIELDIMLSLAGRRDGSAIFATNCGGIYEWRSGTPVYSPTNLYLPNMCIWSVMEDSQGRVWIGSRDLYRTDDLSRQGAIFTPEDGFDDADIFALYETREGDIWIGSFTGLSQYRDGTFTRYTMEDGLSANDTRSIFQDSKGTMWIGTTEGLNRIQNGIIEPFPLLSEANHPDGLTEPYIRAIYEDIDGVLWFGTYGNGIFRLENEVLTNILQTNGLFDNIVSHLIEDEFGYFWMGSNRGISRVSRDDLNAFATGHVSTVRSRSFGTSEGMLSPETNGGFQPNVIQTAEGKLYFPTVRGVAVIDTRKISTSSKPPPVYIESVSQGTEQHPVGEKVRLRHDNAFLEISYTAIGFKNPDKIQFRYRMEGLSDVWYDAGTMRRAVYTRIPPGSYTFRVIAVNSDGIWNEVGATLPITVSPPFWATTWFATLMVLLFGSIVFGWYGWRINLLKRENERKRRFAEQLLASQESERRRIASELHDSLGQQIMVICNRAEQLRWPKSSNQDFDRRIQEIIDSSQMAISDVRSITHGLRPVNLERFGLTESLNVLCEEVQQASEFDLSYFIKPIDDRVLSDKQIHFFRIIQEALANIIKHANASEASVTVGINEGVIEAKVWDNGKGFEAEQSVESAGIGLVGMQERAETLGGELTIRSEPEGGTTITLRIR